jgi:hypothetical protein
MANPAEEMATGITIGWHASLPGTLVEIATASDSAFAAPRRVPGVCVPVSHLDTATGVVPRGAEVPRHIEALEPGRMYHYRAGREIFSRAGRFHTASRGQPFSFLYMSDVHVHNPLPGRLRAGVALLELARTLEPDVRFTVLGGDMLAYGSAYGAWDSLAASPLVTTQMTAFTPGNHDFYDHTAKSRGPGYFNTFVHNPANGAAGVMNTSYFFRYGNALFLSISSEDSWSSDALLEAQKAWFRRVVAENPATFIIAWTHRPFYNGSGQRRSRADEPDELVAALRRAGRGPGAVRARPRIRPDRTHLRRRGRRAGRGKGRSTSRPRRWVTGTWTRTRRTPTRTWSGSSAARRWARSSRWSPTPSGSGRMTCRAPSWTRRCCRRGGGTALAVSLTTRVGSCGRLRVGVDLTCSFGFDSARVGCGELRPPGRILLYG